jgi:hypothetical protein
VYTLKAYLRRELRGMWMMVLGFRVYEFGVRDQVDRSIDMV